MRSLCMALSAALFVILASCSTTDSDPSAPSQSISTEKGGSASGTETSKVSITGLYFNSCVPELVDVTGDLHTVTQTKTNLDGSIEVTVKFVLKGQGVGRVTGDSYNLILHSNDEVTYTAGPPYPYVRSFERVIKLVSGGSNSNATLTLTLDLEVNSSGKVVWRVTSSTTDCQ